MIPLTDQRRARRDELKTVSPSAEREREQAEARASINAHAMRRSDFKDINQAVRGRWPIREETRSNLMETLAYIISHPNLFDPKIVINAGQTLLNADRINMEDEAVERSKPKPIEITIDGQTRIDFSTFTDDELAVFVEGGKRE